MRSSFTAAVVALATAALAAAPGAASAATVSQDGEVGLDVEAAPGERNRLTIAVGRDTATLADAGAPLAASYTGCTQLDEHSVRCLLTYVGDIFIELHDGDDSLDVSHEPGVREISIRVDGGPGDDDLSGGRAEDELDGGGGRDAIDGGPGSDRIVAAERGLDEATATDDVRCGGGHDVVLEASPLDLLRRGCERVLSVFADAFSPMPVYPRVAGGTALHRAPCRRVGNGRSSRCDARMTLRDVAGRLVGRGRGSIVTRPGRFRDYRYAHFGVPVALTSYGRRALAGEGGIVVRNRVASTARIPGQRPRRRVATYTYVLDRR
jgi:Ca2+-binding RTX toxin-like protein